MLIKTGMNGAYTNLHKLGHLMLRVYLVFGLCPLSNILKNTRICFCPHVERWEASTLFSPLKRANLKHWTT